MSPVDRSTPMMETTTFEPSPRLLNTESLLHNGQGFSTKGVFLANSFLINGEADEVDNGRLSAAGREDDRRAGGTS
jgi:hypothetical protein